MSPKTRKTLFNVGSFVLGGVLLYLAFKDVDFAEVWEAFQQANYWWVIPMLGIIAFSQILRAWRWVLMLDALPPKDRTDPDAPISFTKSFYSVMIGNMANFLLPRVGEVARAANMANQQSLSFSSVFGTIVIERVLDTISLALVVAGAGLLLFRRGVLDQALLDPLRDIWTQIPTTILLIGLVVLLMGALVGFWLLHKIRTTGSDNTRVGTLVRLFDSFQAGLLTLFRSRHRVGLLVSTVLLWVAYWLLAHVPLIMFGITETYGVTLSDAWIVLGLGALGFLVPSPGGTGSYHYAAIAALGVLGVPEEPAATYAVFSHASQLILYVLAGVACLWLQGSRFTSLRSV